MRLKINLATRRYVDHRLVNGIIAGALLVCFLLLAWQVQRYAYLAGELKRVKGEAATQTKGAKGEVVSDAQFKAVQARIAFANEVLEKKSLNWLNLLDFLEETVPDGVALTHLEPNPHEGLVKVGGAARSFGNLRLFLENLERSPHFSDVYLLSQNDVKVGSTQQGLVFNLSLRMNFR